MKKIISILLVALILATALASCTMPNLKKYSISSAADVNSPDYELLRNSDYLDFLEKLSDFSTEMTEIAYQTVGNNRNFCISPVTAYMALAIIAECSNGETRQEVLDALGLTYEQISTYTKALVAFRNMEYSNKNSYGTDVVSAYEKLSSSIWLSDDLIYRQSGVNSLVNNYYCDVYAASFKDGTAKKMINQYVEYKTNGVLRGDLQFSKNTDFAIINTLYLKEIWNELGKNLVYTLEYYDFINGDSSETSIQLLKGNYVQGRVYEAKDYSTFYTQTEHGYQLHFIIPSEDTTLKEIFNAKTISEILAIDDYGYVDDENKLLHNTRLLFPRFDASYSGDISEILKENFGIQSLFDEEKCDFSNLIPLNSVCSSVLHCARLNVEANGIQGSPVNAEKDRDPGEPSEYKEVYHTFNILESFGFVLVDQYGTILYSGVINNIN
jgi:serine protease inhibitor